MCALGESSINLGLVIISASEEHLLKKSTCMSFCVSCFCIEGTGKGIFKMCYSRTVIIKNTTEDAGIFQMLSQ